MKVAIKQTNVVWIIISLLLLILTFLKLLQPHIAIGVSIGFLVGSLVIYLQVRQLDFLKPGELPHSNFLFNMLVYTILFMAMVKMSMVALFSSFIGLMGYRYLFFILCQKNLAKGGLDEN